MGPARARYLPSLNADARDLRVTMSVGAFTWEATHSNRGASINGPNGKPVARILRRNQILRVINAQPHERYQEIQSFVELSGIQTCEQKLRDANVNVSRDLDAAARAKQQAIEALEQFWKDEGSAGENHLKWAEQESSQTSDQLRSSVDSFNSVLTAVTNAINARNQLEIAEEEHRHIETRRKAVEKALDEAISGIKDIKTSATVIELLQDAQKFLEEEQEAKHCPVCEQEVVAKTLQERISERLRSMQQAVKLKDDLETAKRNTATKVAVVRQRRGDLITAMKNLSEAVNTNKIELVEKLEVDWSQFSEEEAGTTPNEDIIRLAHSALAIIESIQESLRSQSNEVQRSLSRLNAIKGHFRTVQEKAQTAADLEKQSDNLKLMLQIVEEQRKKHVQDILESVSANIEQLYLQVHPNEPVGGIRFYLNPNRPRSLEFDGRFGDVEDIPPGAYYSESHLDTLGVCVFLALSKHLDDGNTIVVLNDVVTSIDQAHMERFMNLLHDEAENFNQLVITTHYRPWRDRYRYARGPAASIQLIELLHWSLPRGIRHTKTKLSVARAQGVPRARTDGQTDCLV